MYISTRGNSPERSGKEVIALGMVPNGGLFVPKHIPEIDWRELETLNYPDLARSILKLYLPEFSDRTLDQAVNVYRSELFSSENPAPLVQVGNMGVLELWHGPTSAFKDMALQVLPHLLKESIQSIAQFNKVLILVATSGDTGKAALEGFRNVPGIEIAVFYPENGVSAVQERQMTTTEGENTYIIAVKGNFDECQSKVKEIFGSKEIKGDFLKGKYTFSSANSINWGRLLPQIVYYFWAYAQAVAKAQIKAGEFINVVVPTGNFGNILAAYYAKEMGLPIKELICASNQNNVLTEFFQTGVYDRQRPFYLTSSPSMDILISSNFERFLYEMSNRDEEKVKTWFGELQSKGKFGVDLQTLAKARDYVKAGWASEAEVKDMIQKVYTEQSYVLDPHTAVAVRVYQKYMECTGDSTYTIIASTASPFKFAGTVLQSIISEQITENEWENLAQLSALTGWTIPMGLQGLEKKTVRKVEKTTPSEIPHLLRQLFL
ncbi:threonine synthase [Desulfitobacterium metallireducens]|uniref:Threonine synthase n=1 Tax=Desulfitobacterium metallireducens DSM 15288 TaxID=871968 RepID=W0E777_9FIRM|nr:threonine synthase [Desulfitobacterium metallireducens]AHF06700.1 threonine synthase [Desulfitobacterium metallireducens DSM 15288]